MHNKNVAPSPFAIHGKKENKIILSCMDNANDLWAGVQVEFFVVRSFLMLQILMAFQLANGYSVKKNDEEEGAKKKNYF